MPTKKINISKRVQLSLDEKERIVNQIPLYKGNIGQIYAIPKFIKEEIEKKKKKKAQLYIWKCGLHILDIDTQLNSLELQWI